MIDVTCALIVDGNRVLLAQNGPESDHAFQWEFPGGKIGLNESPHACIIREIQEELELEIEVERELVPIDHDYGIKKIRLIPFICRIVGGTLKLNDHVAVSWVKMEELLSSDLSEADKVLIHLEENRKILKEYLGE